VSGHARRAATAPGVVPEVVLLPALVLLLLLSAVEVWRHR
jgi:hypothetical protein